MTNLERNVSVANLDLELLPANAILFRPLLVILAAPPQTTRSASHQPSFRLGRLAEGESKRW